MFKIFKEIDYNLKLATPELSLLKPNGYRADSGIIEQKTTTIAHLSEAYDIKLTVKLSNVNTLEFKLPCTIEFNHKLIDNPNIQLVRENYIIKCINDGKEEHFIIEEIINSMDDTKDYKTIKCSSTTKELQGIFLSDFNTETEEGFSIREVLEGKSTAVGLDEKYGILRKTNWKLGYIDPEYDNITGSGLPFTIRGSSTVLNAILSMAETYVAVIDWDTKNKLINIHKPQTLGKDRGLTFSYGHYLKALNRASKTHKMVTRLYVYGKDGMSIEKASPLGSNYIEDYSFFMFPFKRDENTREVIEHSYYMTDDLCHALLDYQQLIDSKSDELKQINEDIANERDILTDLIIDMQHKEQELIRAQDKHYIYYCLRDNSDEFVSTGRPYTQEEYDAFTQEMGGDDLWQEVVNARTAYEQALQLVEAQENIIEQKIQLLNNLKETLSEENNFSEALLKEKKDFTIEREFRDTNYVDPYKLYDRGIEEFKKLQFPEKTIEIDVVNFLDCIEEQWNWNKLNLGDIVTIKHEVLKVNVKARIVEISFDYESNNISLVISVTDTLDDDYAALVKAINQAISTSIQVDAMVPIWQDLQQNANYVSSVIEKFYDDVADQINLAVNQSVLINEYGITIYHMLDETTKDDMNFLRITNGALGITNDGGQTYKNAITKNGIIGERVIGKLIMGHNLVLGDPDGMLEILGNKGLVRDRVLDPRENSSTYLRGREVMRFGLYNYDVSGVDDYRNPHHDPTLDRFGLQLFGNFSDVLTVNNEAPIQGSMNGVPGLYNAQPLSRITIDSAEGFSIDKWEDIGEGYSWNKKFYVNEDGSLFAHDMTTYGLKIYQKPDVLLLDATNRFINIGRMSQMVVDGALTPLEKIQVKIEWARIQKEFIELQKAYLDHRYTYRGGDAYGNKSNIDHLDTPSSPAWEGTKFSSYTVGFWSNYQAMYNALDKYLNIDIITLPDDPNYPNGSLLSDARKHITERENDLSDNGEILELGTGFNRNLFIKTFTDYYNAAEVLTDAINTLIRWSSAELGKFYNDIRMDAIDGIVVTRNDNKNQIWLSANDGFSIAKNKNDLPFAYYPFLEYSKPGAEVNGNRTMQSWQKLFYVDTNGNLNVLGSLDMLSLDNQTRVLIDQNSPEGIPFSIMGRTRSIGMEGAVRDGEQYSDHTGDWWRKLYIDTDGNLFANDLTANRLILRDVNGDVVLDANSGFFDINKFHFNGNLLAQNIVTGTILADIGHVANLTVNRLKSIDLTKEGREANYVDIENQTIKWITATLEATDTQRTQMSLNRETGEMEMMPLYWTDSERTSTTTYPEDFPNAEPVYEQRIVNPMVKMEMTFDETDPNNIPKIILGAGTGNGDAGKGFIFKEYISPADQRLKIHYIDTSNRNRYITLEDEGIVMVVGDKSVVISEDDGIKLIAGNKVVTIPATGDIKLENGNGSLIEFSGSDINITATGKVNISGTEIHLNA